MGRRQSGLLQLLLLAPALAVLIPQRILCFGDSLTAGMVTRDEYVPYGDVLSASLDARVVSRGVVLESAHAMVPRLQRTLAEGDFDAVILLGGSNDLWTGDAPKILASLDGMYGMVRATGAQLGVATLPPFEPKVMQWLAFTGVLEQTEMTRRAVNDHVRAKACRSADAFLVDLARLSDADTANPLQRPDGMHLTADGYRRLGEEAAAAVREHFSAFACAS